MHAHEIQKQLAECDDRDSAVALFGVFSDGDGERLTFVQSYTRGDGVVVRAHFRYEWDHLQHLQHLQPDIDKTSEEHEYEKTFRSDRLTESNNRLHAMHLLQCHLGKWRVTQWCCAQMQSVDSLQPKGRAVFNHTFHGRRYPMAIVSNGGDDHPELLITWNRTRRAHEVDARFPSCRLACDGVIKAFRDDCTSIVTLPNQDVGGDACLECIKRNEKLREAVIAEGRIGKRARLTLNDAGSSMIPTPDDKLQVCSVHGHVTMSGRQIGTIPVKSVPSGWQAHARIILPHPYEPVAKLQWGPNDR